MQAAILSAIRSALIAVGSAYAAKKGIDPGAVDGIVSGLIAVGAAVWGVVDKLRAK